MFALPDLPYAIDALAPVISERALRLHHGKHHAGYVKGLNELLELSSSLQRSLEDVIVAASRSPERKLFNNAAQAWNHSFFWAAMSPGESLPQGELAAAITAAFGDLAGLKKAFITAGANHFGSGWVWLLADRGGALSVASTHDAEDALTLPGETPLLVCDLWEHAYYLDHQNDRGAYLEAWFDALPNWRLAVSQQLAARGLGTPWRHPAPTAGAAPTLEKVA